VVSVYDGDTITIVARVGRKPYQFKCRLNRIDTAEMRGTSPEVKAVAIEAKKALEQKLLYRMIDLRDVQLEKYGRVLAEIYFRGENVNQWMLNNRYAVEYDGGTKKKVDWVNYRNNP